MAPLGLCITYLTCTYLYILVNWKNRYLLYIHCTRTWIVLLLVWESSIIGLISWWGFPFISSVPSQPTSPLQQNHIHACCRRSLSSSVEKNMWRSLSTQGLDWLRLNLFGKCVNDVTCLGFVMSIKGVSTLIQERINHVGLFDYFESTDGLVIFQS